MKASLENPIYSAYIMCGSTKYNVTGVLEDISFSDREKQFSHAVTLKLADIKTGSSQLSSIIKVRDRVYIYADDGSKSGEVFRGFVWTRNCKNSPEGQVITLRCYDNLIYMQESEESKFFSSGKSSKDVMKSLCDSWGVTLEYTYSSITHSKLALRGYLADIMVSDILEPVKDRTKKKYVIRSEKDVMKVMPIGSNTTVYDIKTKNNVIDTSSECTMDGMTTKVIILGKADDDDRQAVEATVSGDTSTYGTLQKIINRSENTSLADAKKEAQSIIDENGKPKWVYEVTVTDIPWIRKGDKANVIAGDISNTMTVLGIDRHISNQEKAMSLTMELYDEATDSETGTGNGTAASINTAIGWFKGKESHQRGYVGYYAGGNWVMRYKFTTPAGGTTTSLKFRSSWYQHRNFNSYPVRAAVSSSATSHANAGKKTAYQASMYAESSGNYNVAVEITGLELAPSTTYYLWLFPGFTSNYRHLAHNSKAKQSNKLEANTKK